MSEIEQSPHFLDVVLDGSSGEDDPVSRWNRPDALTAKSKKPTSTSAAKRRKPALTSVKEKGNADVVKCEVVGIELNLDDMPEIYSHDETTHALSVRQSAGESVRSHFAVSSF